MRKAFTLIELLVVIAIIAILAAILFPVFAQAKEAAKKTKNLSGIKQLATSLMIYTTDSDDLFPVAMTSRPDGSLRWATLHPFPHNWKLDGTWDADAQAAAATYWANAIYPYVRNYEIYDDSGFPKTVNAVADGADFANPLAAPKARNTLFTYNGLLHAVSSTEVASPSKLPMFWLGFGKSPYAGRALHNPTLICDGTNGNPCRFNPADVPMSGASGGGTWFWATGASAFVFGQGMNYSFADSSAKFRNVGRVTGPDPAAPNTDYNNSPFAHILTGGIPDTMYLCTSPNALASYPCVFRPDQEFNL